MTDLSKPSPCFRGDRPAAAAPQGVADRNELAVVAMERTRMPMVITDPRQAGDPIVLANKAFLDMTGYAAAEVVGRNCRFLQGPGTSAAAIDAIREALRSEREMDIEILNYRKDGSAFWNHLGLSPVHDDNGNLLYFFGSQIDITEIRKVQSLEASEHRLLKEVDHRARNVLAVVSGIVRLSRADDTALYAAAIQKRVQVLAQAHSLLAERGWRAVGLEQIIRPQFSPHPARRVTLEGPPVMVSALAVQPLSLVLHELAENAATHGALSVPAGRLSLRWDSGPAAGGFELRWREDGGPAFPSDPRRGFGAAMVSAMIERQLRGRIESVWMDDGLSLTISIPGAPESLIPEQARPAMTGTKRATAD